MNRLTVVYDASCEFCVRCRWWLARQPAYVELEFVPRSNSFLTQRFPGLQLSQATAELLVVSDDGWVYREERAWIMCLWALIEYREWALRLATPALMPFAGEFFKQVSKRRHFISGLLRGGLEQELERAVRPRLDPHGAHCETCRS